MEPVAQEGDDKPRYCRKGFLHIYSKDFESEATQLRRQFTGALCI